MHIFITGYMGVGKTTVGKELSGLLQLPFIDLDECIVKQEEKTISSIFNECGEAEFRQIEREALLKVSNLKERHVIALGGGTMCYLENHLVILQSGIAIYLYQSWSEISTYLHELQDRPLVQQNSKEELKAIFRNREPFYAKSQVKMPMNTTFEVKKLANQLKILTNR